MRSTPARATTTLAAALVSTLALGACGSQVVGDADTGPDPVVTQEDAHAAAAAREAVRAEAIRLGHLRRLYPTAGLEVPPDTLLVTTTDGVVGADGTTGHEARLPGGWMLRTAE
jgi:hypothetical protein